MAKNSNRWAGALSWHVLGGARYPIVILAGLPWCPLRQLAADVGVSYYCLLTASERFAGSAPRVAMVRDGGDELETAVVAAAQFPLVLLLARPRSVSAKLRALRSAAVPLILLYANGKHSVDEANSRTAVATYRLEVERLRVAQLQRQLAEAKRLPAAQATPVMATAGAALAAQRWQGDPTAASTMVEMVLDHRAGAEIPEIAARYGASVHVVTAVVRGSYKTRAAEDAYRTLTTLGVDWPKTGR